MDADLVIPVFQFPEGEGVVIVLGIGRIDGECQDVPEIAAALEVLFRDLVRNRVRGILHLLAEAVRQAELRQDGMHLGLVLPGLPEEIDDVAMGRRRAPVPAVHDGRDLQARHRLLRILRHGDGNVVRHGPRGHQHPGLAFRHDMEDAHERALRPLQDGDDLAFPAPAARAARLGFHDPHDVLVQRAAALRRPDINVLVLSLDPHEDQPFAVHPHLSDILGEHPVLFLPCRFFLFLLSHQSTIEYICTKIRIVEGKCNPTAARQAPKSGFVAGLSNGNN